MHQQVREWGALGIQKIMILVIAREGVVERKC